MQIAPQINNAASSVKGFFVALGFPMSLALIVFVAVALWYLIGYASEGYKEHVASRQIEAYKAEADKWKAIAEQKQSEADQYLGAASAYHEQADRLNAERTELINARPDLQKQVEAATRKVEAIRGKPLLPVTDDMRERVDVLASALDKLYPDR